MARAPSVSVVVACYNGSEFIGDQLRSILKQTVPSMEIIVSDDGSLDDTVTVANAIAGSASVPVLVSRNANRLGYADNFLRAATRAQGELIAFADQDDVWLPGKLAAAVVAFADPELTLWMHGSTNVDEHLEPIVERRMHTGVARRAARSNPLHPLHGSHIVFRSDLLRYLPPDGRPTSTYGPHPAEHDEWVTFAAHALGRIGWDPAPAMLYRRHGAAVTQGDPLIPRAEVLGDVEETRHAYAVEAARQRALYLAVRSRAPECRPVQGRLTAAAARYRRLAPRLARRVRTRQDPSRALRCASLAGAVARGDYSPAGSGGLGSWSLIQDTYRLAVR